MSSLVAFTLLVHHSDTSKLDRIKSYFVPDTRPDFPEDVPETEEEWVDAFEIIPYPEIIERPDPNVMLLEFDDEADMGPEFHNEIAQAVSLTQPDLILSYSFLEDHILYDKWNGNSYETIWGRDYLEDDQEEVLDTQTIEQLEKLGEDHNKILLFLLNILVGN